MNILLIETSTERGVIAYGNHQNILFERDLPFGLNQGKFIMPFLEEVLNVFGRPPRELTLIGVGIGPGSYTGIRIGVAVAQTLSYAWKVPLIGVSSLVGFVPEKGSKSFAAVIDARMGGIYFQKGSCHNQKIVFQDTPEISSLNQMSDCLQGISHFVTPTAKSLKTKIQLLYPDNQWSWEERGPSIPNLFFDIEDQFAKNEKKIAPFPLEILYLKKTEAERNWEAKEQKE